jgi:hypothetical protein
MLKKLLAIIFGKTNIDHNTKKIPTKKSVNDNAKSVRKGELGEYKINIQLDQLPKDYKYLNDILVVNPKSKTGYSQVDHLVITPYGIFIIETKNYNGEIKGNKSDRYWYVNKRFKMYNPNDIKFISMVSFTMRCRFSIDPELRKISSDELVIYDVELSEFIQRKLTRLAVENNIPLVSSYETIQLFELISKENIIDPVIRKAHIEKIKGNKEANQ